MTVRIRILVPDSGPAGARDIGDEVEVAKDEATRLVDAGRAEFVRREKKPVEKAVK